MDDGNEEKANRCADKDESPSNQGNLTTLNPPMTARVKISPNVDIHYSKKLNKHFDIMIFIERYPLKRCQGCVKLIASKVNCFLNITDLSEVQLYMHVL